MDTADEATWAECNDIVDHVKHSNVHEGMQRLCTLALDTDVTVVREWTHATIADTLEWYEASLQPPCVRPPVAAAPPSTFNAVIGAVSLQAHYDLVKEHVLSLLLHRDNTIPDATMMELQQLLADDVDDTALFVELANVLLCQHPLADLSAAFEARLTGHLNDMSLPARFNLWTQFPHLWELQIATWLQEAHVSPLRPMLFILLGLSQPISDGHMSTLDKTKLLFREMYQHAPHLHVVVHDVCQRLLDVYPTHRMLECVQSLAGFTITPDRSFVQIEAAGGMTARTWWQVAQDTRWIHATCCRVLCPPSPRPVKHDDASIVTNDHEEAVKASWLNSLVAIYAVQCPTIHVELSGFATSFVEAIHQSSTKDVVVHHPTTPFAWLQQHRTTAARFAPLTITLLCNWMVLAGSSTDTHDVRRSVDTPASLSCIEYLFRLTPPPPMTRRAYQVSLLGVFLACIEGLDREKCPQQNHLHDSIARAGLELVRLMAVDDEVALPVEWQRHATDRLKCHQQVSG
ncbi:hypothetical protein, variant [Aphanomyces astaci]|uniref:Uncharacterized protein n=1 Tax=Aphanomyces astaci TaxID=112090 RepID=W4G5J9_APHAT|nr:hypothetical protein, variant [Aphanomyces astaci]ETV74992.1 hypothetical protein, variant [Aphanomyces astaci]|eukprot:XP_009835495.1 hypothetical protein, variant [Aphanomyces astaci]